MKEEKVNVKNKISKKLHSTELGKELLFNVKKLTGKIHRPDMEFPELISLETASVCNLRCIHCPPQSKELRDQGRPLGLMDINLFMKLMDEIDKHGRRRIALHKDGEPLLHPQVTEMIKRTKKNVDHIVYLTTNAHKLTDEIADLIIEKKIDVVNFSIGAATEEFYRKVRGKNFNKVMNNIHNYLDKVEKSEWKPRILVQIIRLPEFPEMEEEIKRFKKYWKNYPVEVQVWDKLTWGVYDYKERNKNRYPCYSLWESFTVNSDGLVSACCIDWQQKLITGDTNKQSIEEIWKGGVLRNMRKLHVEGRENELPICGSCNYWDWQQKLDEYAI
ncbi:MAG: radical SAM protein [Ignavibacteria bacterium]|nr:MAG: radical SAM protein [Ignavibacteria bacterium]